MRLKIGFLEGETLPGLQEASQTVKKVFLIASENWDEL